MMQRLTLQELKEVLHVLDLPGNTSVVLSFENEDTARLFSQRKTTLEAMKKLRGSGNGNLVKALQQERAKDKV